MDKLRLDHRGRAAWIGKEMRHIKKTPNAEPGRPTRVGYVSEEEEMNDDDDDEEIQSGDDDANPGNESDEEMTPAE